MYTLTVLEHGIPSFTIDVESLDDTAITHALLNSVSYDGKFCIEHNYNDYGKELKVFIISTYRVCKRIYEN